MWKSSLMIMLSVALKIKLHFCNCTSPLHSCDTELLRDKAERQQRKFSKCTLTGRGQKHTAWTLPTLAVPAGGWDPTGPTESCSQHQLGGEQKSEWQSDTVLCRSCKKIFNVKTWHRSGMRFLSEEKLHTSKILSFTKRWQRTELSELHDGTSSLVKINSEWLLTIFHKIWTRRNTGKLGRTFKQAKALYFYLLQMDITEPVTMVCLDVSNLRQTLNAINKMEKQCI